MARADPLSFEHWLAQGGLVNRPLAELFNGFVAHLLESGVRLRRAYMGMSPRHPLIRAFDMTWEPREALNESRFDHSWGADTGVDRIRRCAT